MWYDLVISIRRDFSMKKISDDDLLNQIRNFYKKNTKITKKIV